MTIALFLSLPCGPVLQKSDVCTATAQCHKAQSMSASGLFDRYQSSFCAVYTVMSQATTAQTLGSEAG
jgi:hypothetical protein